MYTCHRCGDGGLSEPLRRGSLAPGPTQDVHVWAATYNTLMWSRACTQASTSAVGAGLLRVETWRMPVKQKTTRARETEHVFCVSGLIGN